MKVFDFRDYKEFLGQWLKEHPKGGRGQLKIMADALQVSTTLISQVLRADKHLSLETAAELTEYLGLNEKESEYFLLLVEYQRAGHVKLKKILEKKLNREQQTGSQLKNKLNMEQPLTDEDKSQYYSSWMYSAIRTLIALPEMKSPKKLSERLQLPLTAVNHAVHFLLDKNICRLKEKELTHGPHPLELHFNSPFINKHHQNWRLEGFKKMELKKEDDVFLTRPLVLSQEGAQKIKNRLPQMIDEINSQNPTSEKTVAYCLNIDWFEI